MTPRRPSLAPLGTTSLARRGVLLAGPTLLLAGCGLLPSGTEDEDPAGGAPDEEAADLEGAAETEDESSPAPGTSATIEIDVLEVEDEMTAGGLMTRMSDSETMIHPHAQATVVATTLLDSLTAEQYTALTGKDVPEVDDPDPEAEEEQLATVILPGQLKRFLLTAWESTDSEWAPTPNSTPSTSLNITYSGNQALRVDSPGKGDAERSGTVLAIVDASPDPAAVALRAETGDGIQELSLIDGSLLTTPAPRMYAGGLEVQVSDATVLETKVSDGFAKDYMTLRGTIEEAYLSPYVQADLEHGGRLGWAGEDEIHLVIPLIWDRDYSANVDDLTEVVLVLPDGTELHPAQDQLRMFGSSHRDPIATFTIPAALETATVKIMPRFGKVLNDDFEQVEEPVTATLTFH
ncbi:MAG: hypothetical protein ACTHUU_02595 [Brachybacterium sp.]